MNFKQANFIVTVFMLMFLSSEATANLALSSNESHRLEEVTGICMLASQGVYEAAISRQAGESKENAKKNLKKEFKNIRKNFKNDDLVAFVEDTWDKGLEIVYKQPVLSVESDKKTFVSQAVASSFNACINDLYQ